MAASVGTLVFEYCSKKTRNLGLGLVTIGYNVGVVLGGIVSLWIISAYGWRSIFVFGGVMSALLIPVVYFFLPESLEVMVAKPRAETLARLNRVMVQLGLPTFDRDAGAYRRRWPAPVPPTCCARRSARACC